MRSCLGLGEAAETSQHRLCCAQQSGRKGPSSVVSLTESAHLLRPGGVPFQPAQALGEYGMGTRVLSHPFLFLDPQLHAVVRERASTAV